MLRKTISYTVSLTGSFLIIVMTIRLLIMFNNGVINESNFDGVMIKYYFIMMLNIFIFVSNYLYKEKKK